MMEWEKLLQPHRFSQGCDIAIDPIELGRSPFSKDQDKITFSSSFRRLAKKTQVHPLANNDHVHTRLTHSIEVASVGRSIGNTIGAWINDTHNSPIKYAHHLGEIVYAACLAGR